MERKIILKCRVGSHLYGCNDDQSDEDFAGIFIPSDDDLFGLQHCPTEWTMNEKKSTGDKNIAGDVDCKFFSIQRFMELAAQGQPGQLEMLFVPNNMIIEATDEYWALREARDLFLSKNAIQPFIGFCLSQIHKSTLKGDNYNKLMAIKKWGEDLSKEELNAPIGTHTKSSDDGEFVVLGGVTEINSVVTTGNAICYEIAHRKYDPGLKTRTFLDGVDKLLGKYGNRTKASANEGTDRKNLYTAYRLIGEARELLEYGNITFPRPNADVLYMIKRHGISNGSPEGYVETELDYIRQVVEPKCPLPQHPDRSKITQLCKLIIKKHLVDSINEAIRDTTK